MPAATPQAVVYKLDKETESKFYIPSAVRGKIQIVNTEKGVKIVPVENRKKLN